MDDFAAAFGDVDVDLDFGIQEAADARAQRIQKARQAAARYVPQYEEPGWFVHYGEKSSYKDDRDRPHPTELAKAELLETQHLYARHQYGALLESWPSKFLNQLKTTKNKKTRKTKALASDADAVLDNHQVELADLLLRSALHTTPPTINEDIITIARLYKRISKTNASFGLPAAKVLLLASEQQPEFKDVFLDESLQSLLLALSYHPNFYLLTPYDTLLSQVVPSWKTALERHTFDEASIPSYITSRTRKNLESFLVSCSAKNTSDEAPVKSVREL